MKNRNKHTLETAAPNFIRYCLYRQLKLSAALRLRATSKRMHRLFEHSVHNGALRYKEHFPSQFHFLRIYQQDWKKEFEKTTRKIYRGLTPSQVHLLELVKNKKLFEIKLLIAGEQGKADFDKLLWQERIDENANWRDRHRSLFYWAGMSRSQLMKDFFYQKIREYHDLLNRPDQAHPIQEMTIPSLLLCAAFLRQSPDIIFALLLEMPDEINKSYLISSARGTPLMFAAAKGYTDIVRMLLKADNIDVKVNRLDNALSLAVKNRRVEVVKELVQAEGIDVNIICPEGSPLFLASSKGYLDIVSILLQVKGINPDLGLPLGAKILSTPLAIAAVHGYTEIVSALLKCNDVQVNVTIDLWNGATPLIAAVLMGSLSTVKCLIEEGGADITIASQRFRGGNEIITPLEHARDHGHEKIVEYLETCQMRLDATSPRYGK